MKKESSIGEGNSFNLGDDLIYDTNECTDGADAQTEMSPYMVALATRVRSDVEYIIETFGREVGEPVITVVLDLLEKMVDISGKNDRLTNECSLYSTENTQLKRTVEKEKMCRLDAESNMFQMEEEVSTLRKIIRNYESKTEVLENRLSSMKHDENIGDGDTLMYMRRKNKKSAFNDSQLSNTTGDVSPKLSASFEDYPKSKRSAGIGKENKSPTMAKKSIFYDIVRNKNNWENLANKVERSKAHSNIPASDFHDSLQTELQQCRLDATNKYSENKESDFEENFVLKDVSEPGLEELLIKYKYLLEQNRDIIPKMQGLVKENEESAKELDRVSNDLFRVKTDLAEILDKSMFLPEYIKRLHKEITELNHRVRVLYKDNKENESSVESLRKKCDHWRHSAKVYRDRLAELQEVVEWNENYNSCLVPVVPKSEVETAPRPSSIKNFFSKIMKKAKIQLRPGPRIGMDYSTYRRRLDSYENITSFTIGESMQKSDKDMKTSLVSDKFDTKIITGNEKYLSLPECETEYKSTPLFVKPLISNESSMVWIAEFVDFSENSHYSTHQFQKTLWVLSFHHDKSIVKVIDMSNYNNILSSFVLTSCKTVSIEYVRESNINSDFTSLSQGHQDFMTNSHDISSTSTPEFVTNLTSYTEIPSHLPTVWIGCKNGRLQVHSAVENYNEIMATVQFHGAIVSIVHMSGRVFVSLYTGAIAVFQRSSITEKWVLSTCRMIEISEPIENFGCITRISDKMIWCGVEGRIIEFNAVETSFERCIYEQPLPDISVRSITASKEKAVVVYRGLPYIYLFSISDRKLLAIFNPFDNIKCIEDDIGGLRVTSVLLYNQYMVVGSSTGHMVTIEIDRFLKSKNFASKSIKDYKTGIYSVCHTKSVKFILGIDFTEELRTYIIITGGEGVKTMKISAQEDVNWEVTSSISHLLVWAENV